MKIIRNICAPFLAVAFVAYLATSAESWLILTIWFAIVVFCSNFLHKLGGHD